MEGADVVTPGPTRPPSILHIRKNTQKSKFLLSQAFKKIMFFVIPEMPSKTLVCFKKNFLITLTMAAVKTCKSMALDGSLEIKEKGNLC